MLAWPAKRKLAKLARPVCPRPRAEQPFGRGNDSHSGDPGCRPIRRLNARLAGRCGHILSAALVEPSCAGMRSLPLVVPSGGQVSRRTAEGTSLAAVGLCPRSPRNCSTNARSNGLPSPNGPGNRECEPPLGRGTRVSGGGIRARIGHKAGTAPRFRRSQAWHPSGPRLSECSNLCL